MATAGNEIALQPGTMQLPTFAPSTAIPMCLCALLACGDSGSNTDPESQLDAGPVSPSRPTQVDYPSTSPLTVHLIDDECIYVSSFTELRCVALDGTSHSLLAAYDNLTIRSLVVERDWLYGTAIPFDFGPSNRGLLVWRLPRSGGELELLQETYAGYGAGVGFTVTDDALYYTTGGSAELYRHPKVPGEAERIASDSGNFGDLAYHDGSVYYVNGATIYRKLSDATDSDAGEAFSVVGLGDTVALYAAPAGLLVHYTSAIDEAGGVTRVAYADGTREAVATGLSNTPVFELSIAAGRVTLPAGMDGVVQLELSSGQLSTVAATAPGYVSSAAGSDATVAWIADSTQLWIQAQKTR